MAMIDSFSGIRFPLSGTPADWSTRISPPYDVLDAADKARLLAADRHNIVAVDLPHVPPKSAGPESLYQEAARTFRAWLKDGILEREMQPAIYAVAQTYAHQGRSITRRGFLARLRLEEFGQGRVFAHEQTFGGPKEDRLRLFINTQANLSPVFCLYPDPTRQVSAALQAVFSTPPQAMATQDQVRNELWIVRDPTTLRTLAQAMQDKAAYIADGHHRYSTGLNYLKQLEAEAARSGYPLPADHPARFILTFFVDMSDPGLVLLPTHRLLEPDQRLTLDTLRKILPAGFDWQEAAPADAPAILRRLNTLEPGQLALYDGKTRGFVVLRFTGHQNLHELEPAKCEAWCRLDLAALHRILIEEAIKPRLLGGTDPKIRYIKDAARTLQEADQIGGLAVLVRPNTVAELEAVCAAGDLMPQKSTYFYPKIPTGLVLYDLTAH